MTINNTDTLQQSENGFQSQTSSAHSSTISGQLQGIEETQGSPNMFSRLRTTLFGNFRQPVDTGQSTSHNGSPHDDVSGESSVREDQISENPARHLRTQIIDDVSQSNSSGKVIHDSFGAKLWQTVSNTTTTSSLSYRSIKGALAFFSVMNILLNSSSRSSSTNDQINAIHEEYQNRIVSGLVNRDPFNQFPGYLNEMIDGQNGLFERLTASEEKSRQCHSQLFEKVHNKFSDSERKYEAFKNETLAYLEFQDELMQDITANFNETESIHTSQLSLINADINEALSAIELQKTYALAEYEEIYANAQQNMDNAEETLAEIKEGVAEAQEKMEKPLQRLEKNNKGLRGKIVGPLVERLNHVDEQLQSISDTSNTFVGLGKTPEEFKAELDSQFKETEDLLKNSQRSVELMIENSENGLVTHATLENSHHQASQDLKHYIDEDQSIQDTLDDTENIAKLLELMDNSTSHYIEQKKTTGEEITNETVAELSELYNQTVDEVEEVFTGTLSESAKRKFAKFDNARDILYKTFIGLQIAGYAYIAATTTRRFVDEIRNKPNGSCLKFLNERLKFDDEGGIYAARVQAGRDTEIKVKDLRGKRNCRVALNAITSSRVFGLMAAIWIGRVVAGKFLEPAFDEINQNSKQIISNLNNTVTEAQAGYTDEMKATCMEIYDRKYRVDELNQQVFSDVQNAYDSDPQIKNAVDYLQEEDGLECQFSKLNETLADDDRAVIEAECEKIAKGYVEDYFIDSLDQEKYIGELHDLVDTLTGEESQYKARESSENYTMIALIIAHFISTAAIYLNKYKNPDTLEIHQLASKDRKVTKREIKRIPKVLAKINHTLHHYGLTLKEGNLLVVEPGHMKGYDPKKVAADDGSVDERESFLPSHSSLDNDGIEIDLEAGEQQLVSSPGRFEISPSDEAVEVYFSVDQSNNRLKLFYCPSVDALKQSWNNLWGKSQEDDGAEVAFTDSDKNRVADILADLEGELRQEYGFILQNGNIVVTNPKEFAENLPKQKGSIFKSQAHSAITSRSGYQDVEVVDTRLDMEVGDDNSSPGNKRSPINLERLKPVETFGGEGEVGIEISFKNSRWDNIKRLLQTGS